ncbi:MAG: NADH-quinone oxidoreductase subunit C [Candidatus Omnitrophota bacterium]
MTFTTVEKNALTGKCEELKDSGFRLIQIGCAKLDTFEMTYSFEKGPELVSLRLCLPPEAAEMPSISGIFEQAFLYENEIHDLYGVKITGMIIDYKNKFYRTKVRWPFSASAQEDNHA